MFYLDCTRTTWHTIYIYIKPNNKHRWLPKKRPSSKNCKMAKWLLQKHPKTTNTLSKRQIAEVEYER